MSNTNDKNNEKDTPQPPANQQISTISTFNRPRPSSSNVATFSSMAKVAESLVNGGASIMFNSYNNSIVFKWVSQDINESLSIDIINRIISNIQNIYFTNGSFIKGISNGFTLNNRGQVVQQYDENIALSTAFGYDITQISNSTIINLNTEIEARQSDSRLLLTAYQQTEQNIKNAESLVHYLEFDTDNHVLYIVIPVESEEGELSHGDALPSETLTMDEPEDGVYDPSIRIEEVEEKKFTNFINTQFDKDGLTVYGDINCMNIIAPTGSIDELQSSSIIAEQLQSSSIIAEQLQSTISITEDSLATNSIIFPTCYLEDITKSDGSPIETEHPLAGETIDVPTEIPTPLDDNYTYYLFLGGVVGDTVRNPNLRGRHYYIENDEQKFYTERITTEIIQTEKEQVEINTIHFDIGKRRDVIPSEPEFIVLDEQFTFDNITLQGTLFYPQYQIYGISQDWETPNIYTLPTTLSVSSLVSAGLEAAGEDVKNALEVIQSNAQQIQNIHNSKGGFDSTKEESYNWKLWTYIRRWIMKGIQDFIDAKNDVKSWGENFPESVYPDLAKIAKVCEKDGNYLNAERLKVSELDMTGNTYATFGSNGFLGLGEHSATVHIYKGELRLGSEKVKALGATWVPATYANLNVIKGDIILNGTNIRNLFAYAKHTHSDYAPTNHTHSDYIVMTVQDKYITLGDGSKSIEVYNKEAIDEMMLNINNGEAPTVDLSNFVSEAEVDSKMKTIKNSISQQYGVQLAQIESKVDAVLASQNIDTDYLAGMSDLKKQIEKLTDNLTNILSAVKAMEDNQRILFKLVDLYTEISNIKGSLSNIENRLIALENQKSSVDAIKQMLISLDAAVKSNDATVATFRESISSLQVNSQTAQQNIAAIQQAIGTLQTNQLTTSYFIENVPSTYLTITSASNTYATQEDVSEIDERLGTAEGNITAMADRLGTAEEKITALEEAAES